MFKYFLNFSCEKFHGEESRLILSYLPVITVILVNPILFLVTYRKGNHLLYSLSVCNLNGRENDERTQVDTNTNKITPGLNGA